jgi:hypothetical protein
MRPGHRFHQGGSAPYLVEVMHPEAMRGVGWQQNPRSSARSILRPRARQVSRLNEGGVLGRPSPPIGPTSSVPQGLLLLDKRDDSASALLTHVISGVWSW